MKYEWRKYIDEMRRDGYAVCVIAPEDLKGIHPQWVEAVMEGEANVFIEDCEREEQDNDESSN